MEKTVPDGRRRTTAKNRIRTHDDQKPCRILESILEQKMGVTRKNWGNLSKLCSLVNSKAPTSILVLNKHTTGMQVLTCNWTRAHREVVLSLRLLGKSKIISK